MKHLIVVAIWMSCISCGKDPVLEQELQLPDTVSLGASEVYLNNNLEDYSPRFFEDTVNHQMILTFVFNPDFSVLNALGFGALALEEGQNILHKDRVLYKGAHTTFHQIINGHNEGWEFELIRKEEGFLTISRLDTINQTVAGSFKAYFEVVEKNGYEDTKLPEMVTFQGVFHDSYSRG